MTAAAAPQLDLTIARNNLGLFQATAILELPTIAVSCMKADRDDLEYQLRREFSEIVEEIVTKLTKDEF